MPTESSVHYSILWQPGLGALVLAVAAFTLLVLVTSLLNAFERKGGERVYTQEYRYRFYAVFSALMFVIVAYALGTFVFVSSGGLFKAVKAGEGWAQITLAFSSVMPVLLLELIYTRNLHGLGFTVNYGQALPDTPLYKFIKWSDAHYRRLNNRSRLVRTIFKPLFFLPGWLAQYLFNALMLSYVIYTAKKLKGSWSAINTWLQLLEDVLVWMTTVFFLLTFTEGVFRVVFGSDGSYLFSPNWVLLGFMLASLGVLALAYFLLLTKASGKKNLAIVLPFAVLVLILFDLSWQLKKEGIITDWGLFLTLFGGFGPLAALILLLWLGTMFVEDYDEIQGRVNELIRQEVSANFLDRALHNFGNALPTIEASFRAEGRLLGKLEERVDLFSNGDIPKIVQAAQSQLANGREALEKARNDLDALKSGRPNKNRFEWVSIHEELARLGERRKVKKIKYVMQHLGKYTLYTDRDRFRLMLENLVDNACDAMFVAGTRNPRLTLKIGRCGAGRDVEEPFRNGLYIDIQDNGPGIPSELRERVFEPYFSTKASGMGIGLTIAKAFMAENNGSIAIRANNPGACFRLSFPAEKVKVE